MERKSVQGNHSVTMVKIFIYGLNREEKGVQTVLKDFWDYMYHSCKDDCLWKDR